MNIKNALGFFCLGLLMHTTPLLAQSLSDYSMAVADTSVRSVWVQFMSWVIGGIGLGYLTRDAALRMPALLTAITPARLLRPIESRGDAVRLPAGARVGLSN